MATAKHLTEARTGNLSLAVFWIGAAYLIVAGWLINWWIVPIYKFTPPEQINETIWAPDGPVFIVWAFAIPFGAMLAAIGMSLAEPRRSWPFILVGIFVMVSAAFPQALEYSVPVFGIFGGLIALFFVAIVWFWAKKRRVLQGPAKAAADLQVLGYMFFLSAAWLLCGVLGNPFHTNPGLYFPEKVLEAGTLPLMYAQGTKVSLYIVLGFFFGFLSHYKGAQAVE